jgi:hypothetical protein
LGFLKQVRGKQGRRVTPNPVALGPIMAAGFQGAVRRTGVLAVPGKPRLSIVIARLPGIDPMGQDSADGSRLPHGIMAGRSRDLSRIQPLGDLPAGEVLLD